MTQAVNPTNQIASAATAMPRSPSGSDCLGRMWKVYTESMEEGGTFLKSAFRLTNAATFWAKYFNPETSEAVSNVGSFCKQAKNVISIAEAPLRLEKAARAISSYDPSSPFKSAANVTSEMCGLVSTGCDTIDFIHNVATPMPKELMENLKTASYASTFIGSLKGTVDSVGKVATQFQRLDENEADQLTSAVKKAEVREKTKSQIVSTLIGLASKISYLVLGALGIASLFVSIAPVAIVGMVTIGTILGFAGFFYDRVVDPNDDRARKLSQSPFFQRAVQLASISS